MASILIIDDEATLARNAARFLEKGGHGASVAGTGREGLRQFAELRPDAVVLDYRLPDMDGLAVIAAIRADDAQVPIIMITGHGSIELAVEAMKAGANDLLTKPVALGELRQRIGQLTQRQRENTRLQYYEARERDRSQLDARVGSSPAIAELRDRITRIVSEPDKGLYDAMNKGIRLATGDYLCFLNAGDSFHEDDTLQQMVHTLPGSELPDVMYGETALVDKEGHFVRMRRLSAPETLTWKSFRQGMLVCHQAFFAKRTLVEPYNLKYRFSADFDWCIRIMRESSRRKLPLRNVHAVLTHFLDGGMTTQNHKASLKERFQVMRTHYGLLPTLAVHAWFVIRGAVKR